MHIKIVKYSYADISDGYLSISIIILPHVFKAEKAQKCILMSIYKQAMTCLRF